MGESGGQIVCGSLTEETRDALAYLRELYSKKIFDSDFALRAQNNLWGFGSGGKMRRLLLGSGGHSIIP